MHRNAPDQAPQEWAPRWRWRRGIAGPPEATRRRSQRGVTGGDQGGGGNILPHKDFRHIEAAKPLSMADGAHGAAYAAEAFKMVMSRGNCYPAHVNIFRLGAQFIAMTVVPVREEAVNMAVDSLIGQGGIASPPMLEVAVEGSGHA